MCVLYIYIYISSFIVNPMTHRSREQTKNQTIRRRKHNIIALTITKSRKSPTLPYDCPITPLPLLSSLMLLSAILVLLLIVIVIVISKLLKRYSKAKRNRAPAYSRALRRIKGGFPKGVKRSSGPNSRVPGGTE